MKLSACERNRENRGTAEDASSEKERACNRPGAVCTHQKVAVSLLLVGTTHASRQLFPPHLCLPPSLLAEENSSVIRFQSVFVVVAQERWFDAPLRQ